MAPKSSVERKKYKRFSPDDPRERLNRARSNLAKARAGAKITDIYIEDLCFDAQQAAEKAIKAVLIKHQIEFPFVHDLAELIELLEKSGEKAPKQMQEAARLTRYAVVTRYPGAIDPVTEEEYEEALAIATNVVRWAERRINVETSGGI